MAGKVTNDQVAKATLSIDDFRNAVNYKNPTNKGYVRFVPDGNGGVKLDKVNNKIDFMISWRTNIDAQKNMAMRQKFVAAMTNDLRWADQTRVQRIADKIALAVGDVAGSRTDALSRKELETAFRGYDDLMNTAFGRIQMIDNLLKATAERCGLGGTDNAIGELKKRFLDFSGDLADPSLFAGTNDGVERGKPGYMKMAELDFKTLLHNLELKCDEAVKKSKIENLLKNKAEMFTGAKALDNTFGLHLSLDETAELRGTLLHFLSIKGLAPQQGEAGVIGTGGMVFEKFMTTVLPELFKQGVESVRQWGGENGDAALATDANFSYEAIMDEAVKFMREAQEFLDNPPKEAFQSTGDRRFDNILASEQQVVNGSRNLALVGHIQSGVEDVEANSNMDKADVAKLMKDAKGAAGAYKAEGLLEVFTKNFLARRGIGEEVKARDIHGDAAIAACNKVLHEMRNVGIAARLQAGAASKDPVTGLKLKQDDGMGHYLRDMTSAINDIASGKDGMDMALVGKLLSFTLANIASRKVEMVGNGIGNDLKLGEAGEAKDMELLRKTADAYFSFESTVGKTIAKAKTSFEKMARAQLNRKLIRQEEFNAMIAHAQSKFAGAHKAALTAFFLKSPVEDADAGAKMLSRIFNGKMDEAMAELSNELAVNALGHAIGVKQKGILARVEEHVMDAMAQPGLADVKLGIDGVIGEKEARGILLKGELKRLYSKTLAGMIKKLPKVDGHVTVTDNFVDKVKAEFNSKAKSFVKEIAKKEAAFLKECGKLVSDYIDTSIDMGRSYFKGYTEGDNAITKAEREKLVKEMTAEVLRYKSSQVKASVEELLEEPAGFNSNKTVQALSREMVGADGVEKTGVAAFYVAEDRKKMVADFLAGDDMNKVPQAIAEGKTFGKGGPLGGLYKGIVSETSSLINRAQKVVVERVKKLPLVYATGDRNALVARIADEANKVAEGYAKKWMKFRAAFLDGIKGMEADFSSLGEKSIEAVRNWVLAEISTQEDIDNLDVRKATGYFRQMLQGELDGKISKVKTSFAEYSAKVENVLQPAMEALRSEVESAIYALDFNPITDEAKAHLENVVIPKMMERIEFSIYQNPDNYTEDRLDARRDEINKTFVNVCSEMFRVMDVNRDKGLEQLVKLAGADVLLTDDVEKKAAFEDAKKWIASPEGHSLRAESEKAMLDFILDYGDSFDAKDPASFAPTAPGNAVAAFRFAARDLMRGHTAQLLYSAFDNSKVGEARDAFATWLDSHGLSRFEDYRKTTAQERIMAKFAERVKALQDSAVQGGEAEPILTPAFIGVIDQIIDSDGTSMLLAEANAKFLDRFLGELDAKDDSAYKFDPNSKQFASLPLSVKGIVRKNRENLEGAISVAITTVLGKLEGLGGLDDVKAAIAKLDDDQVRREVTYTVADVAAECMARFDLIIVNESLQREASNKMERTLIVSAVGEEKAKSIGSLEDMVYKPAFRKMIDDKTADALPTAIANIHSAFTKCLSEAFTTCFEKEATVKVLENTFRKSTENFIAEVESDKANWKKVILPALKAVAKGL